jgi:NAD(P)-dependent dehydrogenase (short-subunit alcohol dehydrogenase family)
MKTVVITGSTRGIGRGLAENFLKSGCNVVISGRSLGTVETVRDELAAEYGADSVSGTACEITSVSDLQALWDHGVAAFGRIDVWVNNAGMSIERADLKDQSAQDISAIVNANLGGLLLANHVVLGGMQKQGDGQIWNMEGFGSGGEKAAGMMAYGATKAAVGYLNKALQK